MRQRLFDHGWIFDARSHLERTTTIRTGQDVYLEHPLQPLRPCHRHVARRLKRVFKIDILTCADCGGALKVIASIEDPAVIKQILAHLERRAEPATPVFRPFARAPPPMTLPSLKEPG